MNENSSAKMLKYLNFRKSESSFIHYNRNNCYPTFWRKNEKADVVPPSIVRREEEDSSTTIELSDSFVLRISKHYEWDLNGGV